MFLSRCDRYANTYDHYRFPLALRLVTRGVYAAIRQQSKLASVGEQNLYFPRSAPAGSKRIPLSRSNWYEYATAPIENPCYVN